MAWSNKMSRRKKTTLTWVAASALGAGMLWIFWKDLFGKNVQSSITSQKGSIKFTGKVTPEQAAAYKALADNPTRLAVEREKYRQQLVGDGLTTVEVAAALADYDSVK